MPRDQLSPRASYRAKGRSRSPQNVEKSSDRIPHMKNREDTHSEADGSTFTEQLTRISDEGYALVDDDEKDKWLSIVYEGNVGHILCTTLHSNDIADGEEIPTPLAREFIMDDGLVYDEPPEQVKREVNRLEQI